MTQQDPEQSEDYVRPDYSTKALLWAPVQFGKLTLRTWHLLVGVVYIVWLYVYFKTTGSSIGQFYNLNFWVYGWGPVLGILLLVFNTNRAQRFLTYLGWFYVLRGSDQDPITDLYMGVTARRVIRLLNTLALSLFFAGLELAFYYLAGLNLPLIYLGGKILVYLAGNYAILTFLDTWWGFQRTRMAIVLCCLLWLGLIAAFNLFLDLVVNLAACPDWLCPRAR